MPSAKGPRHTDIIIEKCMYHQSVNGYGICSKISNFYRFLFANKMLDIRTVIHKILTRIANRKYPNQTACLISVGSGSVLFVFLTSS